MVRYFVIIIIVLGVVSCANMDELIENGQYDQAIRKGLQKLEKTPNDAVTQKNVVQAYELAQAKELTSIKSLYEIEEGPATWEMIYRAYDKMKNRDRIMSNSGLEVSTVHNVPTDEMQFAYKNMCIAYSDKAEELMEKDTRIGYQNAYSNWIKLRQYQCEYTQLDSIINYCTSNGQATVAFQLDEQKGNSIPEKTRNALLNLPFARNNKIGSWVNYILEYEVDQEINYTVLCTFNEITVSKNKASVTSIKEEKKVIDHYENRKNAEGKMEKVPVYKTVKATLNKYSQLKTSTQGVYFTIIDNEKGANLFKKQLVATYTYTYNYATSSGDLRALSDEQKNSTKIKKKAFPNNSFMVQQSGKKLVDLVYSEIYRQRNFFE